MSPESEILEHLSAGIYDWLRLSLAVCGVVSEAPRLAQ